jgi:hypothetical protein
MKCILFFWITSPCLSIYEDDYLLILKPAVIQRIFCLPNNK